MPAVQIAQLLIIFGPGAINLIDKLIAKISANGDVTLAEWQELKTDLAQTSRDRMLLALKAAGTDPESELGKQLLAYAS